MIHFKKGNTHYSHVALNIQGIKRPVLPKFATDSSGPDEEGRTKNFCQF
jgi:hypothetical protein